jgi:hypothetical protein
MSHPVLLKHRKLEVETIRKVFVPKIWFSKPFLKTRNKPKSFNEKSKLNQLLNIIFLGGWGM